MKKQSMILLIFTVVASLLLTVNLYVTAVSVNDNGLPTASGTETSGPISDHETIIAMLRSFIRENRLADAAVCEDGLSGMVVISYYYVHPEQQKAFETFIKENGIDANEITVLVMESAIEPVAEMPINDTKLDFEGEEAGIADVADIGGELGFMLTGLKANETVEYSLSDETVGKIVYSDQTQVTVACLKEGKTILTAVSSDGQTVVREIEVRPAPVLESMEGGTDPAEKAEPQTTDVGELYFNSQYDYVPVEIGLNSGIELAGYDDGKFYEVGETPIEFSIDDEQIAKIGVVQGIGVNVLGVSAGETILHAKAPDGRTASVRVVVKEAPPVSTTARNEAPTAAGPGDVNMDGKVNSVDARLALRAAAKLEELSAEQKQSADMNQDGKVNSSDARTILRIAAKLGTVS